MVMLLTLTFLFKLLNKATRVSSNFVKARGICSSHSRIYSFRLDVVKLHHGTNDINRGRPQKDQVAG